MIVNPFLGNARILLVRWLTGIIESFDKLIAIGIDIEINANGGVFAWPVKIMRHLEACRGKICILIDWNTDQRGAGDCSPPRSQIIKYLPFYVIVMVNNLYVKFDKYILFQRVLSGFFPCFIVDLTKPNLLLSTIKLVSRYCRPMRKHGATRATSSTHAIWRSNYSLGEINGMEIWQPHQCWICGHFLYHCWVDCGALC